MHDIARENLSASQQRQKRDYDVRAAEKKYTIGDLVFLRDSSTVVGQSSKLRPPWKGPFLVIQVLSPSLIKIQGAKRDSVVHHDRLKFCHGEQDIPVRLRRARHELLGTDPEPETEVPVNGTLPEELLTGPDTSESSGSFDDDEPRDTGDEQPTTALPTSPTRRGSRPRRPPKTCGTYITYTIDLTLYGWSSQIQAGGSL